MKSLISVMVLALLTACAGPRYYPVSPAGEGGYYLAKSPPGVVYYDAGHYYSTFPVYGIQPWWSYTYYSPNFYPHYFSVWYPSPYGYYGWYGSLPYAYPHHRGYHPDFRGHPPGGPGQATPQPTLPSGAAPPAVHLQPAADISGLYRDTAGRARQPLQPGAFNPSRRFGPSTLPGPGARSFEAPASFPVPPAHRVASPARSGFPVPSEPADPAPRALDRSALPREP